MGEKNEINVRSCSVRFDDDVPVFHGTLVDIKGTVRKMLGDKVLHSENVQWTCALDGVPVCSVLEPFGASIRIKMAVIRDLPLDQFKETARRLNGSTVRYEDISEWTSKGDGTGRMPLLVKQLIATGRFNEAQAREIFDDPVRRAKAQAYIDKLLAAAPEEAL